MSAELIEVDAAGRAQWLNQWPRLFGTRAERAHQMLATLAGSMIFGRGITFSMTLLALTLASGQYISCILQNLRSRHRPIETMHDCAD